MKKIFFIIIAFSLIGCEISEEEIRDTTFADISIVPSNIVIDTQISTDNSGRVVITPYADGTHCFMLIKVMNHQSTKLKLVDRLRIFMIQATIQSQLQQNLQLVNS